MGAFDDYMPAMAMFGLQFSYAGLSLLPRVVLLHGMNPKVFVVYRQAIATLVIAPMAYLSRRKSGGPSMGLKSFSLIFLASLVGVTISQNFYSEGLYLASSSMAATINNLVPAITFLLASTLGLEKINLRSFRTIAKIAGTMLCVTGAISIALLKGPKLLNRTIFGLASENWLLGCSLVFASACCWSIWLILQVPINASYPDHVSISAWICFLATVQSAVLTLLLEQDLSIWILRSNLELITCLFAGVIGSGLSFFVQAWCISKRGPLFSAMFNPLSTVIVHIFATLFLHETIYLGSLIGGIAVIVGLYVVLWGKAEDYPKSAEQSSPKPASDPSQIVTKETLIEGFAKEKKNKSNLEEPLLSDKWEDDIEENRVQKQQNN